MMNKKMKNKKMKNKKKNKSNIYWINLFYYMRTI